MKKLFFLLTAVCLTFVLAACTDDGESQGDAIVKADSGDITKDDLYEEMKEAAGDQVLQNMVFEQMLEDEYDVSDELDDEIEEAKEQFDDEDEFEAALEQQGMDEEDFRDSTEQQLLMEKATTDGVDVSEDDMKDYYEDNKDKYAEVEASHIVVDDEDEAKSIKEDLDDDAEFAEMAKDYSTDDDTAEDGGDLGTIDSESQDVNPQVMQQVMTMDEDEISDPMQTQGGFEIIKVTNKDTKEFDDVKDDVEEVVTQEQAKSPFEVLKQLKEDQNVELEDEDLEDALDIDKLKEQQQQQQMQQQMQPQG